MPLRLVHTNYVGLTAMSVFDDEYTEEASSVWLRPLQRLG